MRSWPRAAERTAALWAACIAAAGLLVFITVGTSSGLAGVAAGVALGVAICGTALACFDGGRGNLALAATTERARRIAKGEVEPTHLRGRAPAPLAELDDALDGIEDAMRERELTMALISRATGDAVWDWNRNTQRIAWRGASDALGTEQDEFETAASWWMDRIHPDEREAVLASVEDAIARGAERWSRAYRLRHEDGSYRPFWDRGFIVRNGKGEAVRMIGCATDMSAQRAAEQRLVASERRYRSLVSATTSIVWTADRNGKAVDPVPSWEAYTGQSFEETQQDGWIQAIHPDDRAAMSAAWKTALAGSDAFQVDCRVRSRDRTYRWFSVRGAPVPAEDGSIAEWIGTYTDIQERLNAQQEIAARSRDLAERVKELRCLHAIAVACNREDVNLEEILGWIALVLPSAMWRPEDAVCRIAQDGADYTSPSYASPRACISADIEVAGEAVGRIEVGYLADGDGEAVFLNEERDLLHTVASLIGQTIARRRDRETLRQQSRELARRQTLFEQMEQLANVGGWEIDLSTGELIWTDQTYKITELPRHQKPTIAWQSSRYEGDAAAFHRRKLQEIIDTNGSYDLELPYVTVTGKRRWLRTIGQVETVEGGARRVFGAVTDVTEAKAAQGRMWDLANRDSLTGLPNRRLFHESLESAVSDCGMHGRVGLLLIDLDDFKDVNDTLGHDAGDALLRAVAARLQGLVGASGTVARLGGDEFAVVLPRLDEESAALSLAERLIDAIRRPIDYRGEAIASRATAGVSLFPEQAASAAELLKNADVALYSGKRGRRSGAVLFRPEMRHAMEEKVAVCASVRRSLETGNIIPYYQPKICLRTNRVTGLEALLRRRHPELGIQAPGAIAPAFENAEIAAQLGERMLEASLRDMVAWREQGIEFGHVALNLAEAEFRRPDLVERLLGRIEAAGLAPSLLGIEVTETVLLGREGDTVDAKLQLLHEAGLKIALDDFGTGYASLTHLKQFPVDVLKIDRSFIESIEEDEASRAIALAVIALGHSLGMEVVAEGVETSGQAGILSAAGCDVGQGYHYARPMPAPQVARFVRAFGERAAGEEGRRRARA
ncbi:sensor domain-containing protein [Faunimonas sp. B44]|uniref:sensor domain-containing protein n=1 Tax=Faunimonas sp. B44 TaxID=3461493 RepID=UPI004044B5C0